MRWERRIVALLIALGLGFDSAWAADLPPSDRAHVAPCCAIEALAASDALSWSPILRPHVRAAMLHGAAALILGVATGTAGTQTSVHEFSQTLAMPTDVLTAPFSMNDPAFGITATLTPGGDYTISKNSGVGVGSFGGALGASVRHFAWTTGADGAGTYQQVAFDYQAGAARISAIRLYSQGSVLFITTYPSGGNNANAFPSFSRYPSGDNISHLAFGPGWNYKASGDLTQLSNDSPWLFIDGGGNAAIVSAGNHFMTANTSFDGSRVAITVDSQIATLPAGFTQAALLTLGASPNDAITAWGQTLTDLQGKTRPGNQADRTLASVTAYTDALSYYYYNTEPGLSYEATLLAIRDAYAALGIRLGALQLDSWYYPKGKTMDWRAVGEGAWIYSAAPALFPAGLAAFQEKLLLPFVAHGRWWDDQSPDLQQGFSGRVPTSPVYWAQVAAYLRGAGVLQYEQDWLDPAHAVTAFNLVDPDNFLNVMADALGRAGISLMYCGEGPRYYLKGSQLDNLYAIRPSLDLFIRDRWDVFLYNSLLARATGIWPFTDHVSSNDPMSLRIATWSAGPVGIGGYQESIHVLNRENLAQVALPDGTIVKPDESIVPTRGTLIRDAAYANNPMGDIPPMVAFAHTDHEAGRAAYVVAYSRDATKVARATFDAAELGIAGAMYVYDLTGTGTLVAAGDTFTDASVGYEGEAYVAVPVGASGIGVLGDKGKFTSRGRQRVTALKENGGVLSIDLAFVYGEAPITIYGYSQNLPPIRATNGLAVLKNYDKDTHLFEIEVTAGKDNSATLEMGRIVPTRPPTRTLARAA